VIFYRRQVKTAGPPLLMLLVLILSCIVLSRKTFFWNDELYSYYLLSDPSFRHMWGAFNDSINNSPPLYYAVGWFWAALFGSSEMSLRLFSSLAISFALVILWRVLREVFGNWASMLGLALAFTATLIVIQNANARQYGLFLACTALCVAALARNERHQPISRKSFFINAASFTLLVQSHLFGPIYAAVLIAAQVLTDARSGKLRPRLYFAMAAGVATFALYLPAFFNQAQNGIPRFWIPPAFLQDLLEFYASIAPGGLLLLGSSEFASLLWIALALAGGLVVSWSSRQERSEVGRYQQHLLTVAWALLLVPIAVWLASWAIKPLFFDRYLTPSILGLAILYSAVCSRFLKPMLSSVDQHLRFWATVAAGIATALIGCTLLVLVRTQTFPSYPTPGSGDNRYGYEALPIVVPFSHDYLQRRQYSPNPDRYYFLLDWATAVDPASGDFAPQEYKELSALKRQYPKKFTTILDQSEFLSSHPKFLVLKSLGAPKTCHVPLSYAEKWSNLHCWQVYDRRIGSNPHFRTTRLGRVDRTYELLLEERNDHGLQEGAGDR
jgi:hypothetical protein